MPSTPDIAPGLADFWAPAPETPEALAREVEGAASFASSRSAKYPFGVIYNGPWETLHDGVCVAVRRNACALRRSGVPVFLSSLTQCHWNRGFVEKSFHHELPPAVLDEVGHLTESQHEKTIARIVHFVPTSGFLTQMDRPALGGAAVNDVLLSRTIAFMALEYGVFPQDWVRVFNKFGRIMVPCEQNRKALANGGVTVSVDVVPHPMGLRDPMEGPRKYPGGVRILHVGKWEPRKNQHILIGAFLHTFRPDDDVELTIHSKPFWGAPGYPCTPEESIAFWLQYPEIFRVWSLETIKTRLHISWNKTLNRDQMVQMYFQHHVYVSCGRAEGFDLCAFDGKLARMLLVYVADGGPKEFAAGHDIQVKARYKRSPPPQYNAPEGTKWPDPSVLDYGDALLRATSMIREGIDSPFDARRFKIDSVGEQIRKSVLALAKAHDLKIDLEP